MRNADTILVQSFSNDMTKNFEAVTQQISALASSVETLTKKVDRDEEHSDSDADTQSKKSFPLPL